MVVSVSSVYPDDGMVDGERCLAVADGITGIRNHIDTAVEKVKIQNS